MRNPFRALLKASRKTRKGPLSAALALQRLALSLVPASKPAGARAKSAGAPALARASRPAPGSFIDGRFNCSLGALAYELYTPRGSARRRLPLVVMLHGCAQSAGDFAAGTGMNALADERGFLVLYPQQSASANLGRCWNWHRPRDQKRGAGEPAVIAALTRHAITICKADPARVYIAGMSAGAAAAANVAAAYPDLYVAVGVHSGLACGTIGTLRGALSVMRSGRGVAAEGKATRPLPTIVFHGDQDSVVHPANAAGFLNHLRRSNSRPLVSRSEMGRSSGGLDFTRTRHRDDAGAVLLEDWIVHGGDHAWSGGSAAGSHTNPAGRDASRAMLDFFLARRRPPAGAAGRERG